MRTFFCVIGFPFMEGDKRSNFPKGGRFLSLMVGELALISKMVTCFPLYVTAFLVGLLLRVPPYFIGGDEVSS